MLETRDTKSSNTSIKNHDKVILRELDSKFISREGNIDVAKRLYKVCKHCMLLAVDRQRCNCLQHDLNQKIDCAEKYGPNNDKFWVLYRLWKHEDAHRYKLTWDWKNSKYK